MPIWHRIAYIYINNPCQVFLDSTRQATLRQALYSAPATLRHPLPKRAREEAREMNSRQKGKRGELELAHELTDRGYISRRGQQYCGSNGDADVVGLEGIHIECKRVESLNIDKAMKQAREDAYGTDELPAVFHRKNREGWKVTQDLDDWMTMYYGWRMAQGLQEEE